MSDATIEAALERLSDKLIAEPSKAHAPEITSFDFKRIP